MTSSVALNLLATFILKAFRFIFRLTNNIFTFLLKTQFNSCGSSFRCKYFRTYLSSPQNIQIGDSFCSLGSLYLYAENGMISIGDHCSINSNVQLGAYYGELYIGNNVMIGPNSVLRTSNHSYLSKDLPISLQGHNIGCIIIDDDVWIGSNVVICPNVHISRGCIIAAGAVVTRDTAPYQVYGGNPAKLIKSR